MQNGAAAVKNSMEVFQKTNNKATCDPTIPLLGVYPKELKSRSRRGICIPMFNTALFTIVTIAKMWKNPNVQHETNE